MHHLQTTPLYGIEVLLLAKSKHRKPNHNKLDHSHYEDDTKYNHAHGLSRSNYPIIPTITIWKVTSFAHAK
jgi:hypothetical protein